VRKLGVFFAGDDCHALAAKNEPLVLPLQQHQDVLQQNYMQVDLLRATDAPRQWTFIEHLMLSQVQRL